MSCAALLLAYSPAGAHALETFLSIRQGWAVVREIHPVSVVAGEQEIVLPDIPREAELASVIVGSERVPVELLEWGRLEPVQPGLPAGGLTVSADGTTVRWRPASGAEALPAGPGSGSAAVRCRIKSPVARRDLPVEVVYVLRGFSWSAYYQVAVRGEQAEEKEPVSVDLFGTVRIENHSSRTFSSAVVRLVGADERPGRESPSAPGFLLLDPDSPLSDLWLGRAHQPAAEYEYDVPRTITLASGDTADFSLIRAVRAPALRLYVMASEGFPIVEAEAYAPLRKCIVFKNVPANQLGMALPPGRAEIFLGGMRTHLLQEAWFARVPVDGEIRIDLGLAEDVRGRRSSSGPTPPVAGTTEEDILISIRNLRDADVVAEIDEKPPVSFGWSVVRASKPYREAARRLLFSPEIRARSEGVVEYRVRSRPPAL